MNNQRYCDELFNAEKSGQYRSLRDITPKGKYIEHNGNIFLNLSSNDYLGISANYNLWNGFQDSERYENPEISGGSCSSRLLTGNFKHYSILENLLSTTYKREAALVFNSGYHANIGILPALTTKNDLILSDKLVHASIIDGIKLSDAKSIRYRHNDYNQIEEILIKTRNDYEQVFIATESVFSMDGDIADIQKLVELKKKYNVILYIDEAHAVGVFGKQGLGICEEKNTIQQIDIIIGTFGKAYASQGAYIICDSIIKNYLINTMRSLIFTTALPPYSIRWTTKVFKEVQNMSLQRNHLKSISKLFKEELKKQNHITTSSSQIIPVIIGENNNCIQLSEQMQKEGIFVLPVRPPTVPEGTSRLRFSLNTLMNESDIEKIISCLKNNSYAISMA